MGPWCQTGCPLRHKRLVPAINYDNELVLGEDYDVEYVDNTSYGYASYTISFKGNYSGDPLTGEFLIIENAWNIKICFN